MNDYEPVTEWQAPEQDLRCALHVSTWCHAITTAIVYFAHPHSICTFWLEHNSQSQSSSFNSDQRKMDYGLMFMNGIICSDYMQFRFLLLMPPRCVPYSKTCFKHYTKILANIPHTDETLVPHLHSWNGSRYMLYLPCRKKKKKTTLTISVVLISLYQEISKH